MSATDAFQARLAAALGAEDWATAERLLRPRAAKKGASAALCYNLAQVLVRAGKADQAGAWYRKALAADPTHADAWCELAHWRAERGEAEAAAEAYAKTLALSPSDRDALRGAARTAQRLGEWEAAARFWGALRAEREEAEAALGVLRAALEQGRPEAEALRDALRRVPTLRPALLKTITHAGRGRLRLRASDF